MRTHKSIIKTGVFDFLMVIQRRRTGFLRPNAYVILG